MRGLVAALLFAAASAVDVPWVREIFCTRDKQVTLEVEAGEVNITGVVRFQTRIYRVDGEVTFPSATLRMRAGEGCRLRVVNKLQGAPCGNRTNTNGYHCSDTTSLHTHGLHISPTEDNINTHIEPGEELTYWYNVPSNHLLGTHWYHAHHHGSTALQALGGLAGILLVDAAAGFVLPPDVAQLYDNPTVPPLMLNYIALGTNTKSGFWSFYTYADLVKQYDPVTVPPNLKWDGEPPNETGNFYTVNGAHMPDVQVVSGDATLLRMVHAGDGFHLCLEIDDPEGLCNMTLLARDGVFHQTPYLRIKTIVLLVATRADVAVQCRLPRGVGERRLNIPATTTPTVNPTQKNIFEQETVVTLVVKRDAYKPWSVPVPTSEVQLPSYLRSLMDVDVQIGGETGVDRIEFNSPGLEKFHNEHAVNKIPWRGWD